MIKRKSFISAPAVLNTSDAAMWITGWNEAVDALEVEQAQLGEPLAWIVLDEDKVPIMCAPARQMCNDLINDAINDFDVTEASKWVVRKVFTHPAPPPASKNVPETAFGNISGERAALIAKLLDRTVLPRIPDREAMADMLEADGALADDLTIAYMAGVEAGQKQAQQVAVPTGWALVPIEPTPAILDAMSSSGWKTACYKAMLAAAQGAKLVTKKDHKPDWSAA